MKIYQLYVTGIKSTLDRLPWSAIEASVDVLYRIWLEKRMVFVMGNGGSAATASHVVCDLGKNTAIPDVPRLRAVSLNDNLAMFTAHANDNRYENVFAEQLENLVTEGDAVIAISASGNSSNVLNGIRLAQRLGATTMGWSGNPGGQLAHLVDVPIVVPSDDIQHVEDIHLMLGHMITTALKQAMQAHAVAQPATEVGDIGLSIRTDGRHPARVESVTKIKTS